MKNAVSPVARKRGGINNSWVLASCRRHTLVCNSLVVRITGTEDGR